MLTSILYSRTTTTQVHSETLVQISTAFCGTFSDRRYFFGICKQSPSFGTDRSKSLPSHARLNRNHDDCTSNITAISISEVIPQVLLLLTEFILKK